MSRGAPWDEGDWETRSHSMACVEQNRTTNDVPGTHFSVETMNAGHSCHIDKNIPENVFRNTTSPALVPSQPLWSGSYPSPKPQDLT